MKSIETIASSREEGPYLEALYPSDTIYSGELTANVEQTVTVPTSAQFVVFTSTNDIYVNYDTAATVPTGTISQAGGELNPIVRYVGDTTSISIISPVTTKVTMAFYQK